MSETSKYDWSVAKMREALEAGDVNMEKANAAMHRYLADANPFERKEHRLEEAIFYQNRAIVSLLTALIADKL